MWGQYIVLKREKRSDAADEVRMLFGQYCDVQYCDYSLETKKMAKKHSHLICSIWPKLTSIIYCVHYVKCSTVDGIPHFFNPAGSALILRPFKPLPFFIKPTKILHRCGGLKFFSQSPLFLEKFLKSRLFLEKIQNIFPKVPFFFWPFLAKIQSCKSRRIQSRIKMRDCGSRGTSATTVVKLYVVPLDNLNW